MPSTSKKQHNFMAAVANNPAFAKKVEVPQSVGQDFAAADKSKKFGGTRTRADLQKINKPDTRQGKSELFKKGGDTMASKMDPKMMAMMMAKKRGAMAPAAPGAMKHGGMAKKMAAGGSASSRADGIAQRGKTKGKMMAKGGKAC
jgi:hypothetical protein